MNLSQCHNNNGQDFLDTKVEIDIVEEKPTTLYDIQQILPTVIIFLLTMVFMVTVIPYAFHVVIQQLKEQFAEEEKGKIIYSLKKFQKFIFLLQFVKMSKMITDQAHSTCNVSSFHSKGSTLFASEGHSTVDILDAQPG